MSSTPMKDRKPDYITNSSMSLATEKSYRPILSASKKPPIPSNSPNKKPSKALIASKYLNNPTVPTKNISIVSPSS